MMQSGKTIWITGASTGIGAETALQLACIKVHILVTARSGDKLKALADKAKDLPGTITPAPCDVTDTAAVAKLYAEMEEKHGPIDLVLLNAGTGFGDSATEFDIDTFKKTFDINVNGVANCLEPVLPSFVKRGKGHIAIVASVAGFRGLPKSVSYGPSKAALINLAEALYVDLKPKGIKVQVINPGFVKTPLTDKNTFNMPMLMPVEKGAQALIKGLNSNAFEIIFPWPFVVFVKLMDMLPNKIYLWLAGKLGGSVSKPKS
jgi:short-subunit dehydrogenase